MRNKKAKVLRKTAQKLSIGEPTVAYQIRDTNKQTSIITLHPKCTRAVYKKLKGAT